MCDCWSCSSFAVHLVLPQWHFPWKSVMMMYDWCRKVKYGQQGPQRAIALLIPSLPALFSSRIVPIFPTRRANTMIPNGPARNQFARRKRAMICYRVWSGDKSGMTLRSFERRARWLAGSPRLYSKSPEVWVWMVGDVLSRITTPHLYIQNQQRTGCVEV